MKDLFCGAALTALLLLNAGAASAASFIAENNSAATKPFFFSSTTGLSVSASLAPATLCAGQDATLTVVLMNLGSSSFAALTPLEIDVAGQGLPGAYTWTYGGWWSPSPMPPPFVINPAPTATPTPASSPTPTPSPIPTIVLPPGQSLTLTFPVQAPQGPGAGPWPWKLSLTAQISSAMGWVQCMNIYCQPMPMPMLWSGTVQTDAVLVKDCTTTPPSGFIVRGIYPNPFRDTGHVWLWLGQPADVEARVYDVAGELVVDDHFHAPAGDSEWRWNGTNPSGARCATGVYTALFTARGSGGREHATARLAIAR